MAGSGEHFKTFLVLALGFAAGLGTASYVATTGDEPVLSGSAKVSSPPSAARPPQRTVNPQVRGVPVELTVVPSPPTRNNVGNRPYIADMGSPPIAAGCRLESAAGGPSPEELAENEALDRVATAQGDTAEIDNMNPELPMDSADNSASVP